MKLRHLSRAVIAFLLLTAVLAGPEAKSQTSPGASPALPVLNVATKQAPPFAMRTKDGTWSGLAIDLFEDIGRELGRKIKWIAVENTSNLLTTVAAGKVDAGIAAVTITSKREAKVDFSHGYYDSGLAIAVSTSHRAGFWSGLQALASPAFLGTICLLGVLLLAAGAVIWFVERSRNPEQFEQDPVKGIGNGFWWAAVTMTTVGYGDKAPITALGRFIAVIWMFAALILTAVFTAQLTTALTVNQLAGPVKSLADLPRSRVGIVARSASNAYFDTRYIRTLSFRDVDAGLDALAAGEIDAFVHDEPILRFQVLRDYSGRLALLSQIFEPQDYGIVLPPRSRLREPVNQALLKVRASPRWSAIKQKYFGQK